jgi:hypothetical protein
MKAQIQAWISFFDDVSAFPRRVGGSHGRRKKNVREVRDPLKFVLKLQNTCPFEDARRHRQAGENPLNGII